MRTASGQVLTPPFQPIREFEVCDGKGYCRLVFVYDVPEELKEPDQLVNSCYGLEPETIE